MQGANVLLKSSYDGGGIVQWYDAAEKGNLLGEGTQISIPSEEQAFNVFGDIKSFTTTAALNSDIGTMSESSSIGTGLILNARHPFIIESYQIFSLDAGIVIVNLESSNGDVIYSDIVRSDGSGWQRIEQPIRVPEANGLRLVYSDGQIKLGLNNNGPSYPYVVTDIMEIVGSTTQIPNRYHYFYDWEISFLDVCGRKEVLIEGVDSESIPTADFSINADSIDLSISTEAIFSDSSANAVSWQWDFGDGNFSSEQNPKHNYSEAGIFYVSLLVLNEESCYDSKVQEIVVHDSSLTSNTTVRNDKAAISIFPNPVSDVLNINLTEQKDLAYLEIFSSTGVLVHSEKINHDLGKKQLEVSNYPDGVYYVKIAGTNFQYSKKFIKF